MYFLSALDRVSMDRPHSVVATAGPDADTNPGSSFRMRGFRRRRSIALAAEPGLLRHWSSQ